MNIFSGCGSSNPDLQVGTKMSESCLMNDRGDDENDDAEHDDDDDEDEDDDDDDHDVEDDHMSSSKSYKISGCGSSNPV